MINDGIDQETKNKVVGILKVLFPNCKVYLYGSRARGTFREFSDIDLAVDTGPNKERLNIEEAKGVFDNLNIPYKIDLVDLNYIQKSLKDIISKEGKLWSN